MSKENCEEDEILEVDDTSSDDELERITMFSDVADPSDNVNDTQFAESIIDTLPTLPGIASQHTISPVSHTQTIQADHQASEQPKK